MEWEMGAAAAASGWSADDELLRVAVPTVARGNNLVAVVPPSPAWARPLLAAVIQRGLASSGRSLILAAPSMVDPLGLATSRVAAGSGRRTVTAPGSSRAARLLRSGMVDVLVTSPATAVSLHTRSHLEIDRFDTVVLAWPEHWADDEAVTVLLNDLPRESQRVVLTSSSADVADLVERHLRRAATGTATPLEGGAEPAPPKSVRTVPATWAGRIAAIRSAVEALDPATLSVWTADPADHEPIREALADLPRLSVVSRGIPEGAGPVVCHDLPSQDDLSAIGSGRDVILVVPPGTEGYVRDIAGSARPLRITGAVDLLRDRDAELRNRISAVIESGEIDAAAYLIAPLFDLHDPQAVAAACAALWRGAEGRNEAAARARQEQTPVGGMNSTRIWLGAGRKDEATPGDIVALLVKEIGLPREAVGRIELRDTFSLVEVPATEAERVAQALTGKTIRRRRLIAKVDRGPAAAGDRGRSGPPRGGPRGPSRHG